MGEANGTQRELGELSARVDALERMVWAINNKVDRLLELANASRGAWWLLLKIGAIASALAGAAAYVGERLHWW